MASNGGLSAAASLLDVAIRAAVQSGAPRRTVAATAAAVASVVMVDFRGGGAGASGGASAPSASQRRRTKRKKKADKERAAQAAARASGQSPQPAAGEASPLGEVAELRDALDETVASVRPDVQRPPPLPANTGGAPRTQCLHCHQVFDSRNALFKHLEESGHGGHYTPSTAGDSESVASVPGLFSVVDQFATTITSRREIARVGGAANSSSGSAKAPAPPVTASPSRRGGKRDSPY